MTDHLSEGDNSSRPREAKSQEENEAVQVGTTCSENIRVLIRVRPVLPKESGSDIVTQVDGAANKIAIETDEQSVHASFDGILSEDSTQESVYKQVEYCRDSVINGFNSSILAYGQTGSGKTFTMFGPEDDLDIYSSNLPSKRQGIIPRIIREILTSAESLREQKQDVSVYCSFMQIYNDQPYDLLRDPNRVRPLKVHEDTANSEIYVVGLSEYAVETLHDCLAILEQGDEVRASRETRMNDVSSRSHSIFQLVYEKRQGNGSVIRSKLNLVDLAGSEKWGLMDNLESGHVSELTNINSSLHTLGRCIAALTQKGKAYVPFRDSKLTRILQDALGGNSRTCIIATLSPLLEHANESISTLKFADRAKRVMQHAKVVEKREITLELVLQLEKENEYLRQQLEKLTETKPESYVEREGKTVEDAKDSKSQDEEELKTYPLRSPRNEVSHGVEEGRNDSSPPANFNAESETRKDLVSKGVVNTMQRELFNTRRQLQEIGEKYEKLKSSTQNVPENVEPRDESIALQKLQDDNKFLYQVLKGIKAAATKFFRFDIEEGEFQVAFNKLFASLKRFEETSKVSSSPEKREQSGKQSKQSMQTPRIQKRIIEAQNAQGPRGRLESSRPHASVKQTSYKAPVESAVRIRQRGGEWKEDNQLDDEKALAKSLKKQKEQLEKYEKLKAWVAEKAKRELAALEKEKADRDEVSKRETSRNKALQKRAEQVKKRLLLIRSQNQEIS